MSSNLGLERWDCLDSFMSAGAADLVSTTIHMHVIGNSKDSIRATTVLDVGFGQSVIEGKVNIKSGTEVDHFESDAIVFQDGTRAEADVVVLAYVVVHPLCWA